MSWCHWMVLNAARRTGLMQSRLVSGDGGGGSGEFRPVCKLVRVQSWSDGGQDEVKHDLFKALHYYGREFS